MKNEKSHMFIHEKNYQKINKNILFVDFTLHQVNVLVFTLYQ